MIDNLYLPSGYLDMGAVLRDRHPYIFISSARGPGKTFGSLSESVNMGLKFIYFRRTAKMLAFTLSDLYHPYVDINNVLGWDVRPVKTEDMGYFVKGDHDIIGYAGALSTFANARGISGSEIKLMILDEFIPAKFERKMFNAYEAWAAAYESINRNREFDGSPPLKALFLSNSDDIYSDIIAGFGLGDIYRDMQRSGEEQREVGEHILIIRPQAITFREKKEKTALYQVMAGTDFSEMYLNNNFAFEDEGQIGRRPLREYKPLAAIAGICIYQHKSSDRYYISAHISGSPKTYENTDADRRRFLREQGALLKAYMRRGVDYEGVNVQTTFRDLFK